MRGNRSALLSGASAFFLGFLGFNVAQAQDAAVEAANDDDIIIVTGIRPSLRNAQSIKRDADTVVDVVTASDIGALPDRSVTEALQRVPGVTISRFANGDETDRFAAEGSGVLIRGLNRVRTELNGRDVFSATDGRGLSFEDVPAELMSSVEVFKSQTADMIEGGIAGTVNLRTRVPFDAADRVFAVSADGSFGDLRKEWTPSYSALYSDRFQSNIGEFGILLNYSFSELKSQSHAVQVEPYIRRLNLYQADDVANGGAAGDIPTDCFGDAADPSSFCYFVPRGFAARMTDYDRERTGYAAAAQWQSPDGRMEATYQFLRSDGQRDFFGRYLTYDEDGTSNSIVPGPGQSFEYNSSGTFTRGTLYGDLGWRAYDARINPANQQSQFQGGGGLYGQWHSTGSEVEQNDFSTTDQSIRFNWELTERLSFSAEAQRVESDVQFQRFLPELWFYALPSADLTGDTPQFTAAPVDNAPDLLNPAQYWWNKAQYGLRDNDGEETAFRADVDYQIDAGFIQSVEAGGRFANREQTTRGAYSVGFVGPPWGCCNDGDFPGNWPGPELSNPAWADRFFVANPPTAPAGSNPPDILGRTNYSIYDLFADTSRGVNETEPFYFKNFFRGEIASPGTFLFPGASMYRNPVASAQALADLAALLPTAQPNPFRTLSDAGTVDGTFLPREINTVTEDTTAVYARLNFGQRDVAFGGLNLDIDGNVGVRYVRTEQEASGGVFVASPSEFGFGGRDPVCSIANPSPLDQARALTDPTCFLPDDQVAFATATADSIGVSSHEYENVLPSFNLKLGLTDDVLVRFAWARAMTRPDLGLLRNATTIRPAALQALNANNVLINNVTLPQCQGVPTGDPNAPYSQFTDPSQVPAECVPVNATFLDAATGTQFSASAFGAPDLEAEESDQWDIGIEWYFSDVGSLAFTVFNKKIKNYLTNELVLTSFTNNGVTKSVAINRPTNGEEGELQGFEIGYQQFFDFLPGALAGFGVQANYTYVENKSVPITNLDPSGGQFTDSAGQRENPSKQDPDPDLPLTGLSEDTYNFALLYDRGMIEGRLAYNWRSEYLLTPFDSGNLVTPVWQDDYGQLDGSFFVKPNDWLKVGVQMVNILDEDVKTNIPAQIIDSGGNPVAADDYSRRFGRSWFKQDRRTSLVMRATF